MTPNKPILEKTITLKELCERTGYNRFHIARLRSDRGFPLPDEVNGGYYWSEIEAWYQKMRDSRVAKLNVDKERLAAMLLNLKNQVKEVEQLLRAA
jgi:predicted DNA-binding transcriptional regulator AlpA